MADARGQGSGSITIGHGHTLGCRACFTRVSNEEYTHTHENHATQCSIHTRQPLR